MMWNWQQKEWPVFSYKSTELDELEREYIYNSGFFQGVFNHLNSDENMSLTIDLITDEAFKTSEIEGDYLNRDSIHSSIRRNFGLQTDYQKIPPAEQGISEMLVDLYRSFNEPLTHQKLHEWHVMLTKDRRDLMDIGAYRTHAEAMQIVSGSLNPKIYFEAPPSTKMQHEMDTFITWFNNTAPKGLGRLPALTRAGIAHLYFVCIHPFEDGNGRVARAIAQKSLFQSTGKPTLIALSTIIQKHKKEYYQALEDNNKTTEITDWLIYFAKTVLEAQSYTQALIDFIIVKNKLFDRLKGQLNLRQEKVLTRLFKEGPEGFKGGLSAENYLSITGTTRATATRDLHALVEKGALIRHGNLKKTRYYLQLKMRISTPLNNC
ncbi:MAG: DUF4172 domain-containing protein [Pseudomonadota bacterium]